MPVGICQSARQALSEVARTSPDVVLMDLNMPGGDGVTATRRLVGGVTRPAVLAMTTYDDEASLFAVLRAGARGYVLKGAHQADLVSAIRAVARGEAVFDARVADQVLATFSAPQPLRPPLPELTDRERQVLTLLAQGESTTTIASRLELAPKTVRNHLSNIYVKLQVPDRTQAVLLAERAGLTGRWRIKA